MDEQLEAISKKLSALIALQLKALSDNISSTDAIKLLDDLNISNSEIAALLGMKPNAVSMARARRKGVRNAESKEQ